MAKNLNWPKVYFFGDSLTQFAFSQDGGWLSILANEFQRKADFIARGFSGYNTRQCKALLPYLENDFNGIVVAGIFLGANDANDPIINPQQSVPLNEYKENLKEIINTIKEKSNTKSIFLITPPVIDEDKWRSTCLAEGKTCGNSSSLVAKYAEKCVETAQEVDIPCINLHAAMLCHHKEKSERLRNLSLDKSQPSTSGTVHSNRGLKRQSEECMENSNKKISHWKKFFQDGLHFSPEGASFVASVISPVVKSALDDHKIGSQEMIFPHYLQVSNNDPHSSLKDWVEKVAYIDK